MTATLRGTRALLDAALGFAQIIPRTSELDLLHRWLDSWRGVGAIVGGMRRLGYETEFRQYPQGWPVIGSGGDGMGPMWAS